VPSTLVERVVVVVPAPHWFLPVARLCSLDIVVAATDVVVIVAVVLVMVAVLKRKHR
jgi:hypothetical protein